MDRILMFVPDGCSDSARVCMYYLVYSWIESDPSEVWILPLCENCWRYSVPEIPLAIGGHFTSLFSVPQVDLVLPGERAVLR